jgi:hypothetical protein
VFVEAQDGPKFGKQDAGPLPDMFGAHNYRGGAAHSNMFGNSTQKELEETEEGSVSRLLDLGDTTLAS